MDHDHGDTGPEAPQTGAEESFPPPVTSPAAAEPGHAIASPATPWEPVTRVSNWAPLPTFSGPEPDTATDEPLEPLETVLFSAPIELPCTPEESGPLCDREAAVRDLGRRFGGDAVEQVAVLADRCGGPAPGPTQHCDLPVDRPAMIHAMAGHMHLLGRAIKVELNPGTPGAMTLLDVPAFDFDDQAFRPLPEPVEVGPGDTIRVTCTHDAGLRAMLPQLRDLEPRYVTWGDGTADEMCLGIAVASNV